MISAVTRLRTAPALLLALALTLPAAAQPGEWPVYGGDPANTRYSPLARIDAGNVSRLRVAWVLQLGSLRSQESTPLVVGDTLYVTSSFGPRNVFAVDARRGRVRWRYSPDVPAGIEQFACCDVGHRGVAYARGRVFVGRLDGHLVALDAATGRELWDTPIVDYTQGAVITSPPTLVKNLVITGFGGGEYGVRGFLAALDQDSGREVWRLWTVPGPGEPGHDTWKGDSWKLGGGAVWGIGSYDPALNLLYYGTGNPSPWAASVRGPGTRNYGRFTNLYTATTLAIDPDTGRIVWHFQSTPHDAWDFDGINELVLADVEIDGRLRQVLFKADRNGFFYVLDRRTGALLAARPFVNVNWATGVDMTTGRPQEADDKRPGLTTPTKNICPNTLGAKNWQPMSYNPRTGLVYIPTLNLCMDMQQAEPAYRRGKLYLTPDLDLDRVGPGGHMAELIAWDPVRQQKRWGNPDDLPWLGGTLTTAGGLVFHGDVRGGFKALDAMTGRLLWEFSTGSGISAAPITYELDGTQYVAVVSGRTFSVPLMIGGPIGSRMVDASPQGGALFVFTLAPP